MRKDGTVSYQGTLFEVPYELAGKTVHLVVDPHAGTVVGVEDDQGNRLGAATPLDALANSRRVRRKPEAVPVQGKASGSTTGLNLVELAYHHYHGRKED